MRQKVGLGEKRYAKKLVAVDDETWKDVMLLTSLIVILLAAPQ